ncbi:MAG TPA: FkbM family methyltransferase [Candidatus Sulfotelmatobacter sp.]|nr:FkbM family methyltransferase [Candidatus Sulfotelmatobacter sp.]
MNGPTIAIPEGVALALQALARGDAANARALYDKLLALPDIADAYRHLVSLLGARLGLGPLVRSARDQSHAFYQPSRSCQIERCGALYESLFGLKRDGTFVDVGAFDGEWLSNTAFLADLGWSGLMIEPHPVSFELCRARHQDNRRVHVMQCAVGAQEGTVRLMLGEALSTTVPEQRALYRDIPWARNFTGGGEVEVAQLRLDKLLDVFGVARGFDLLSIDVEGAELGVLRSFDLGAWCPRAVIVEMMDQHQDFARDPRTLAEAAEIRRVFDAHGYAVRYADSTNTVFARDPAA